SDVLLEDRDDLVADRLGAQLLSEDPGGAEDRGASAAPVAAARGPAEEGESGWRRDPGQPLEGGRGPAATGSDTSLGQGQVGGDHAACRERVSNALGAGAGELLQDQGRGFGCRRCLALLDQRRRSAYRYLAPD